ncbi:MAG: HAMP domain-containing histidine kinase, partial [Ruminococcus sp.]|nr:HAMP domain-containing histidine kinase [Ruminococcus sp.]
MIRRLLTHFRRRRRKRTTFIKMFVKGMIIPIIITVILGNYSWFFIRESAFSYGYSQMESVISSYEGKLHRKPNKKMPYPLYFSMFGDVDAQPIGGYIDPKTWVEPSSRSVIFAFDKNGNILYSSRAKIGIAITKGERNTLFYYYDPQDFKIPELDKLIDDGLNDRNSDKYVTELDITKLYLNEAEQKMIPLTIKVSRFKTNNSRFGYDYDEDWTKLSESTINIDYEAPVDYVLTEIASRYNNANNFPCGSIQGVFGTPPQYFDEIAEKNMDKVSEFIDSDSSGSIINGGNYSTQVINILINRLYTDGDEEGVFAYIETNVHGLHAWRRLYFMVGLLFGLMTLFVFVVCFSRNAQNKAQYAFEDYQRALTNNLAHDLKTPLAVIGGYAENLLEMRKDNGDEKELKYLTSIMSNISYTDDIIAKTLKLSETEQIKKLNKTKVDIKALAEKSAEKYRTVLEERDIDIKSEGSCEINADEDTMMTVIENLISNAVKYTRDG